MLRLLYSLYVLWFYRLRETQCFSDSPSNGAPSQHWHRRLPCVAIYIKQCTLRIKLSTLRPEIEACEPPPRTAVTNPKRWFGRCLVSGYNSTHLSCLFPTFPLHLGTNSVTTWTCHNPTHTICISSPKAFRQCDAATNSQEGAHQGRSQGRCG